MRADATYHYGREARSPPSSASRGFPRSGERARELAMIFDCRVAIVPADPIGATDSDTDAGHRGIWSYRSINVIAIKVILS